MQGLVTLEDILEEIVGEFTTDPANMMHKDVHVDADGSFVVNASASVRALNRAMHWNLPTDGPKTLNGLIVEYLEAIPEPGTSLKIRNYAVEVLQTGENAIKTVRTRRWRRPPQPERSAHDSAGKGVLPRRRGVATAMTSSPSMARRGRFAAAITARVKPCRAASRSRSSP